MLNIKRDISDEVISMSKLYPVVTILGPRQSGKTTLAKMLFEDKPYVSMESPDIRELAISNPRGFFETFEDGAIIDEIQKVPSLFSYIQEIVDQREKNGLFILTGSNMGSLQEQITQSLAGRTAILKLLPFSINELKNIQDDCCVDEYIFSGMYPRVHKYNINPTKFYRDYVNTYLERDVRQIINIKNLRKFQLFLKLCASRIGQIFNSSNIANEVGISHTTIMEWLSVLEASFVIIMLKPYYENFGKRVIKSPKLYFTDIGLASYMLEINTIEQISRDPSRGSLFENFVIMELFKHQFNSGLEPSFYYYNDSNGNEIDCLYRNGASLTPIEIKSSKTFDRSFLKGINKFNEISNRMSDKSFIIYSGSQEQSIHNTEILNFKHLARLFE